jgi:hypothetical protein
MSGWSGQATSAGVRQSPGKRDPYSITPSNQAIRAVESGDSWPRGAGLWPAAVNAVAEREGAGRLVEDVDGIVRPRFRKRIDANSARNASSSSIVMPGSVSPRSVQPGACARIVRDSAAVSLSQSFMRHHRTVHSPYDRRGMARVRPRLQIRGKRA